MVQETQEEDTIHEMVHQYIGTKKVAREQTMSSLSWTYKGVREFEGVLRGYTIVGLPRAS